jgi:hypothetical protein
MLYMQLQVRGLEIYHLWVNCNKYHSVQFVYLILFNEK